MDYCSIPWWFMGSNQTEVGKKCGISPGKMIGALLAHLSKDKNDSIHRYSLQFHHY